MDLGADLDKQARKPRSYVCLKLCPPSDRVTGVECRATSVAENKDKDKNVIYSSTALAAILLAQ